MSCSNTVPLLLAIIANTMDAAPRSPAHETNICCRHLLRKGVNSKHTTAGLATNVKNNAIISDGKTTAGSADGNANSPTRKKTNICIKPVTPSKKCTSDFLLSKSAFPSTIPNKYALRYPLPPTAEGTAYAKSTKANTKIVSKPSVVT